MPSVFRPVKASHLGRLANQWLLLTTIDDLMKRKRLLNAEL
jgi:hypothetical protein